MRGDRFAAQPPPPRVVHHGYVVSTPARTMPLTRHWGVWDARAQVFVHAALPVVQTSTWDEFVNGEARIEISTLPALADVVVARARSQLGEKYNLLWANCEQFAKWAATGKRESVQLQRVGLFVALFGGWMLLNKASPTKYDRRVGQYRDKRTGQFAGL